MTMCTKFDLILQIMKKIIFVLAFNVNPTYLQNQPLQEYYIVDINRHNIEEDHPSIVWTKSGFIPSTIFQHFRNLSEV